MGKKKGDLAKRKWPALSLRVPPHIHEMVDEYLATLEYKPTVQQWLENFVMSELRKHQAAKEALNNGGAGGPPNPKDG